MSMPFRFRHVHGLVWFPAKTFSRESPKLLDRFMDLCAGSSTIIESISISRSHNYFRCTKWSTVAFNVLNYTPRVKKDTKLLPITSTNINHFQNSFTSRLSRKFVTKPYLNTPPHPKRVATLPCEISVFKKSQFLRSK